MLAGVAFFVSGAVELSLEVNINNVKSKTQMYLSFNLIQKTYPVLPSNGQSHLTFYNGFEGCDFGEFAILREGAKEPKTFKFNEEENPLSLGMISGESYDDFDGLQVESSGNKFRPTGEDFLIMCYTCYRKNQEYTTTLLKSIYELVSYESQLQLELGIFTLSCIIEDVDVD